MRRSSDLLWSCVCRCEVAPPAANQYNHAAMFNTNPRQQLAALLHKELERVLQFKPAERVDSEPAGLLDVIYAYRLFLGRWPEFDTVKAMKAKAANHAVLPFI